MSAAFPRIAMVTVTPLLCPAAAQDFPEQKVHRSGFTPVGDEAFAVITESYEYDPSWPLDAHASTSGRPTTHASRRSYSPPARESACRALTLAALEDLAAAVACAVPMGDQPATIDPFNFAPRTTTPTLLLIGRTDWMSSPADAKMLRDLMPIEDRKPMLYDAGHRLPPQFVQDAVLWLTARLRQ